MRVLVTGGRDLDPNKVCAWLCENAATVIGGAPYFIMDGGATGADQGASFWRARQSLGGKTYPADWTIHGAAAGPIRNARMIKDRPDVVIAFPGNDGTANCVSQARAAGVRVIEAAGDFKKAGAA